jgi:GNAT superfamily N-acetyltransferase
MIDPLSLDTFGPYWFSNFGAVMLLGSINSVHDVRAMENRGADWGKLCLGSFNIRPNYPGRSSHVCNGAFLVTDASRNRGVGRLMGECYLEWAPRLVSYSQLVSYFNNDKHNNNDSSNWWQGYTYSVFNLVYETNVASCRIWDALGFKRIGRVPGCGNLRSYPGQPVDAIIYGRDLRPEGEDFVCEERFDKIRFYLKHLKYPSGADRAEKSRLRSAATHYKLIGGENGEPERLMLKDKEVVSDPKQQYEIAMQIHLQQHGGINKTTANIALKYHWVRIKETVSLVIKNCEQCKDAAKASHAAPDGLGSHVEKPSLHEG